MKVKRYVADFETTTQVEDCRVWGYGICEISRETNFMFGNSIEDFMEWCKKENKIIYFHNLKFDGEFILSYLFKNGYKHIRDKKCKTDKSFYTIISDTGKFYSMEIYFKVGNKKCKKVVIYDSLKIIPFSVDEISEKFKFTIKKLTIDYKSIREKGHKLTIEEIEYIENDVKIIAKALDIVFKENLLKMTIGGNAMKDYRERNTNFRHYFPQLEFELDQEIRKSYKGGFTYLNPIYEGKIIGKGIVLDVNSLYPSVMCEYKLPYGRPIFYKGKYKSNMLYPLYIQRLSCSFKIKPGKIPTIQLKNNLNFLPNEYIEDTKGDIVVLTLTNIDLELFLKHYDVYDLEYHSGWCFKGIKGLFNEYVKYWMDIKIKAKKEENDGLYILAKLMLNNLYGKFGTNPKARSKYPELNENGIVIYKLGEIEIRNSMYVPMASFITSYARRKTITAAQNIRDYSIKKYDEDYYVYSDTDSIHCLIEDSKELKDIIAVDKYKLGYWDEETKFKRAKFLRQKSYIEETVNGKQKVTIAGMPKSLHKYINIENFEIGYTDKNHDIAEKDAKLRPKHVRGGVILEETDFTIKDKNK